MHGQKTLSGLLRSISSDSSVNDTRILQGIDNYSSVSHQAHLRNRDVLQCTYDKTEHLSYQAGLGQVNMLIELNKHSEKIYGPRQLT